MPKIPPSIPQKIYRDQYVLLVNYGNFDIREGDYDIPEPWSNVNINNYDIADTEMLKATFTEIFKEYLREVSTDDDFGDYPSYVYYLEFEDVDKMIEFEDLLSNFLSPRGIINIEEYYLLIRKLPQFKQIRLI